VSHKGDTAAQSVQRAKARVIVVFCFSQTRSCTDFFTLLLKTTSFPVLLSEEIRGSPIFKHISFLALQLAEDMATKQTKKTIPETAPSLISNEKLQQMYSAMLKCRILEAHARDLRGRPTLKGKEAAAVGATIDLQPDDALVFPANAAVGGFLKGASLSSLFAQLQAKNGTPKRKAATSAGPGAQSSLATGVALARGTGKTGNVTLAFLSQHPGQSPTGHEALLFADAHKLPIVYVDIDDGSENISAAAYRFPVIPVDGSDVVAVYRVAHECIVRARRGGGPSIIACRPFSVEESIGRSQDPLRSMENYLSLKGLSMHDKKQRIIHTFEAEIKQAIKTAGKTAASKKSADSIPHLFYL
jgi:TPP-dependent pyruvate/acetoin dehydrogenase alpha subunit